MKLERDSTLEIVHYFLFTRVSQNMTNMSWLKLIKNLLWTTFMTFSLNSETAPIIRLCLQYTWFSWHENEYLTSESWRDMGIRLEWRSCSFGPCYIWSITCPHRKIIQKIINGWNKLNVFAIYLFAEETMWAMSELEGQIYIPKLGNLYVINSQSEEYAP